MVNNADRCVGFDLTRKTCRKKANGKKYHSPLRCDDCEEARLTAQALSLAVNVFGDKK